METNQELIAQNEATASEPETPSPAPDPVAQVARIAAALTPAGPHAGAGNTPAGNTPGGEESAGEPQDSTTSREVPNDAPSEPEGSGDDVPPPSSEESGDELASRQASQEQPEAEAGAEQ